MTLLTGVFVGVGVFSGVLVAAGVLLGVGEGPGVGVPVGVLVGAGSDVFVGVLVGAGGGVFVGVAVGPDANVSTSCGGEAPSRELKVTPFVLSGRSTKSKVPLPVTYPVTLYSAQVLAVAVPRLKSTPVVGAGRLFQVMPVSVQVLLVP